MLINKGRLNEIFFTEFFKEGIEDMSPKEVRFNFNIELRGDFFGLFLGLDLIEVYTGLFFNRFSHGDMTEGFRDIDVIS